VGLKIPSTLVLCAEIIIQARGSVSLSSLKLERSY
jgi:hypothetical protein